MIELDAALLVHRQRHNVFVVVVTVVRLRFFVTTPLSSGRLGCLRHRHSSSSRHRSCLCQVTTIRINVEKVFQFFPGQWADRPIMTKIGGGWSHVTKRRTHVPRTVNIRQKHTVSVSISAILLIHHKNTTHHLISGYISTSYL